MYVPSNPPTARPIQKVAAAAIATVITLGIAWGIGTLFQSRGTPLEFVVAAERACADKNYQSDLQACMNNWMTARQERTVAAR